MNGKIHLDARIESKRWTELATQVAQRWAEQRDPQNQLDPG